jgi:transcriptional regulator with XRE-family HTH domain
VVLATGEIMAKRPNLTRDLVNGRVSVAVRSARAALKMTQAELAKKVGMSQSRLSKIERAIFMATATEWFYICEVLNISADLLMEPTRKEQDAKAHD